uniref:SJCHGC08395 protein n=1 Tax=Schistosoma japonicum TaxID=6182 RepID=Q5DEU4_SCHJA|nr:SJCHGC08395 protein [Schistosoma japonicum]
MVVAPELFTPERAWNALEIVQKRLTGPIGMCTLSRDDLAYRGYYDNSNDSCDYSIARGFNYHQGPEWIWPTGYYLRARLKFARMLSQSDPKKWGYLTFSVDTECQKTFARLNQKLESNQWFSLPELTNSNGQVCKDSCEAQAWSVGCILEALYELIFNQNK